MMWLIILCLAVGYFLGYIISGVLSTSEMAELDDIIMRQAAEIHELKKWIIDKREGL